jgi:tetratricopeptide (TPR) repeat protein
MRRTLAICLLTVAAAAGNAFAGAEARMTGKVVDAVTKKPVTNVTIHVSATEARKFETDFKGDKDGTYRLMLVDGTIRYKFTFSAPGYQPYEETMKLKIGGEKNEKVVELQPADAAAPATTSVSVPVPSKGADPSIVAFNEGATAYNEQRTDEAIAKFKQAVAAKPEMIAGWEALSRSYLRKKDYNNAIDAATKALELAPDETDMYGILSEAYTATGDKAKAAAAAAKMPKDAAALFNDAVKFLNAGKDAQAEPLLKQAIAANDKLAVAYYELGMLYARAQKNADAKANLSKYLELDPNGKDAATAKEMLKYVQ